MEGGKVSIEKETGESCMQNAFLIKRLSFTADSPYVQVDFSPIQRQLSCQQDHHKEVCHSFPVFNLDACYYTPAFVLEVDKEKYVANAESYQALHQSKKEELSQEKPDLFVPKPSKSNSFCCICKTTFEDYLTHVTHPRHQQLMRGSQYSRSITDLCSLYERAKVEAPPADNKKRGRKTQKSGKMSRLAKRYMSALLISTSTNIEDSNNGNNCLAV